VFGDGGFFEAKNFLSFFQNFLPRTHKLIVNCFMSERKIALFGGTFDPVHIGHTTVAAAAREYIGAQRIVFVPAKRSPLKDCSPEAGDDDRFAMIALAIAGREGFELSDYELNKAEPSYTLETVRRFQVDYGSDTSVHWLAGADVIDELPRLYRITELIDQCNLSMMYRAGCEPPDFARFAPLWGARRVKKLQENIVPTPLVDISSTDIRAALAAGREVANMLDPLVADYIREHNLYKPRSRD
jgi:nicotinate-nucleotide adenylyltransferase